jgi:hypothetical protein
LLGGCSGRRIAVGSLLPRGVARLEVNERLVEIGKGAVRASRSMGARFMAWTTDRA